MHAHLAAAALVVVNAAILATLNAVVTEDYMVRTARTKPASHCHNTSSACPFTGTHGTPDTCPLLLTS